VTEVLRQIEPNLPVRAVHATRGKFLRAEPIAAANVGSSITSARSGSSRTSFAR
jgi:phage terminase large subunit-like protein